MFAIQQLESVGLRWAPRPLRRISDVFVFPLKQAFSLDQSAAFHNYYSLKSFQKSKLFCIRSHDDNFCITPAPIWRKQDQSTVYSTGVGLYQNKECLVLLIECFSKTQAINEEIENINTCLQSAVDIVDCKISTQWRWNASWINISIVMK